MSFPRQCRRANEAPSPTRGSVYLPAAFFSTDLACAPVRIIEWFVLRWNVEVTFEESRRHLGVETQRQWSERAIARTTPALLELFSFICLMAAQCPMVPSLVSVSTTAYHFGIRVCDRHA